MTTSTTEFLQEQKRLTEAATPGPWEADGCEVSQHWSRPEPWLPIATNEVACMAYCYGGSARGIETEADAEFIAAARSSVPKLIAALEAVEAYVCKERDEIRARYKKTGAATARSLGYADACGDVLALLDAALGGEGE